MTTDVWAGDSKREATSERVRKLFVYGVPVFGPLLGTNVVPSFDDVDKLMMALSLTQGLLLSCLGGGFSQTLLGGDGGSKESDTAINMQFLSFQCLCLALLFTIITYSYLVYLIDQERGSAINAALSPGSAKMKLFWTGGGRFVLCGLVTLTLTGAGLYVVGVRNALQHMYTNRRVPAVSGDAFLSGFLTMPTCAIVGALLIHVAFRNLLTANMNAVSSRRSSLGDNPNDELVDPEDGRGR